MYKKTLEEKERVYKDRLKHNVENIIDKKSGTEKEGSMFVLIEEV